MSRWSFIPETIIPSPDPRVTIKRFRVGKDYLLSDYCLGYAIHVEIRFRDPYEKRFIITEVDLETGEETSFTTLTKGISGHMFWCSAHDAKYTIWLYSKDGYLKFLRDCVNKTLIFIEKVPKPFSIYNYRRWSEDEFRGSEYGILLKAEGKWINIDVTRLAYHSTYLTRGVPGIDYIMRHAYPDLLYTVYILNRIPSTLLDITTGHIRKNLSTFLGMMDRLPEELRVRFS